MVLPVVIGLLAIYALTILVALTLAPYMVESQVPVDVYLFVLKATILWSGLTWISIAVYISLISETDTLGDESWLAFIIGSLMVYLGIAGEFVADPYWIGVRSLLYLLLSLVGLVMFIELMRVSDMKPPSERLGELLRRAWGMWRRRRYDRRR